MEDLKKAFEELQTQIEVGAVKIETLVKAKREEMEKELHKLQENKKEVEQLIKEQFDLSDILDKCKIEVCAYRTALEEIKKKHFNENKYQDLIVNRQFHFLLCYRQDYTSKSSVIEAHQEIISSRSFCWFGKFYKQREKGGNYSELEPFGESIRPYGMSSVSNSIKNKVQLRRDSKQAVYLFLYNPNPPNVQLHVANVIEFYFCEEKIPYEDDPAVPNQCANIPDYYFLKNRNCLGCKKQLADRCELRFTCNFWFKINDIIQINDNDVPGELVNLKNCFTKDQINLAVPILYPLLVTQDKSRQYFIQREEPISQNCGFEFCISKNEKAHTKTKEVKHFFDQLNFAAKNSFVKVEMSSRITEGVSKTRIKASEKPTEIILKLASGYRVNGDASIDFTITLDKNTTLGQRKNIEMLINKYLENNNL